MLDKRLGSEYWCFDAFSGLECFFALWRIKVARNKNHFGQGLDATDHF